MTARRSATIRVCIITDDSTNPVSREDILDLVEHDSRFVYLKNEERMGFYGNFEECLSRVPMDADFVALADQDDCWDKDKLSSQSVALRKGTNSFSAIAVL